MAWAESVNKHNNMLYIQYSEGIYKWRRASGGVYTYGWAVAATNYEQGGYVYVRLTRPSPKKKLCVDFVCGRLTYIFEFDAD